MCSCNVANEGSSIENRRTSPPRIALMRTMSPATFRVNLARDVSSGRYELSAFVLGRGFGSECTCLFSGAGFGIDATAFSGTGFRLESTLSVGEEEDFSFENGFDVGVDRISGAVQNVTSGYAKVTCFFTISSRT